MKIVYIAEKEELQSLIRECIREKMEVFLKELNKTPLSDRLDVVEAADYFNVSKSTVYKMTMNREIPYHKFGKRIFFYREEIEKWLKEHSAVAKGILTFCNFINRGNAVSYYSIRPVFCMEIIVRAKYRRPVQIAAVRAAEDIEMMDRH